MSGKLDQSLDEILNTRREGARRARGRGGRRAPNPARKSTAAPVDGVKKSTRAVKPAAKPSVPNGSAAGDGESKIIVNNLPVDIDERQIKEYFGKTVGPIKRVTITYGPNGVSRGIAMIIFSKPGSANDALVKLNGIRIDDRPMKVEVVLDASRAPPPESARRLSERITKPKTQPKQTNVTKSTVDGKTTRASVGGGRGRGARRAGRAGRPKAKTAEELDAEMVDYFDPNSGASDGAATNGVAQPTVNGGDDLGMDEIS